jgi:hypothetical protein
MYDFERCKIGTTSFSNSPRLSVKIAIASGLALILLSCQQGLARELNSNSQSGGGVDGNHFVNKTDSNVSALSTAYAGSHGHASSDVTYGSLALDSHSASTHDATGGYYGADAHWDDTITITPSDASLVGKGGKVRFSYGFSGDFQLVNTGASIASNWSVTLPSGHGYGFSSYEGGIDIHDVPGTITDDVNFTFGVPFSIEVRGGTGTITNGSRDASADSTLTLHSSGVTVFNSAGTAVGYSMTSNAGSSAAMSVAASGAYSGFSATNGSPFGQGTTVQLLDGSASTEELLNATFLPAPAGVSAVSDAVDFSGAGGDLHVLQLSYNPALAISLFGSENNVFILTKVPGSDTWTNTVNLNSDGGAQQHFFHGGYNAATEFALGNYGVDTTNHVAWAVVDHNSQYVVSGAPVPEPASWMLLMAAVSFAAKRRGRQVSSAL